MSERSQTGAVRRRLDADRWHFQHGPIDCIVAANGQDGAVAAAIETAWARFQTLLAELVGELALLRSDLSAGAPVMPRGPVARRMVAACRPHGEGGRFITAMAAVAGSVAEDLLCAFDDPRIARASINNGGDIALRLTPGTSFEVGVCADPRRGVAGLPLDGRFTVAGSSPVRGVVGLPLDGRFTVAASSPVRGISTSGWLGRSFSLGIADSVTVLATSAARADAAATIVANAVDVDDSRIVRAPASAVRDDSDLGDRLVVRAVAPLPLALVEAALARGAAEARAQIDTGRIIAAVLSLQGRWRVVGEVGAGAGIGVECAGGVDAEGARSAALLRSPRDSHPVVVC